MTFEQAKNFLSLNYRIRRKCWKKNVFCVGIKNLEDYSYMIMDGVPSQRLTKVETQAIDWERA